MDFDFLVCSLLGAQLHVPRLGRQVAFFVRSAHAWIVREYEKFSGSSGKFSEYKKIHNSANTQCNQSKFGE